MRYSISDRELLNTPMDLNSFIFPAPKKEKFAPPFYDSLFWVPVYRKQRDPNEYYVNPEMDAASGEKNSVQSSSKCHRSPGSLFQPQTDGRPLLGVFCPEQPVESPVISSSLTIKVFRFDIETRPVLHQQLFVQPVPVRQGDQGSPGHLLQTGHSFKTARGPHCVQKAHRNDAQSLLQNQQTAGRNRGGAADFALHEVGLGKQTPGAAPQAAGGSRGDRHLRERLHQPYLLPAAEVRLARRSLQYEQPLPPAEHSDARGQGRRAEEKADLQLLPQELRSRGSPRSGGA